MRNLFILLIFLGMVSCSDLSKLEETPQSKFIGVWKLEGRKMFEGISIEIKENPKGELVGKVLSLNNEKYVQLFLEVGDTWVSGIERSSNYEFQLTEKKLAAPLFAMYGQSTSKTFRVQFIDENTIGLSTGNVNPATAKVNYKRISQP